MNIEKIETGIPGCFELISRSIVDSRGTFQKVYQKDCFEKLGLFSEWVEQYYSISNYGVVRGMHFQRPPYDHAKLVFCTSGEVVDVAVDLRVDSPTYGRYAKIVLGAAKENMVYIPSGFAHGFLVISKQATLVYNVSSGYMPTHDSGIRWDSVGVDWPGEPTHISERDQKFEPLSEFHSPFLYSK